MGAEENIAAVRRFYSAGPADNDTERVPLFTSDALWHVPGENPVSGTYEGVQAITVTMVERMQPLDDWRIELRDVMGNADLVMATVEIRGRRGGMTIASTGGHVFRLTEEARIAEVWGFVADQARLDDFFRG